MRRITITADEHVLDRLRGLARDRHMSLAALIREALEEKVASAQPRPKSGGSFASGRGDRARRVGDERALCRRGRSS